MISIPSPAKINWFLHLHDKRPDNYHELTTYFQFISLCDEMTFKVSDNAQIDVEGLDIPLEQNLIYKAAKALQRYAPNQGAHIKLTKNIPMGGGLGGGSSNAATTLIVLNQLWDLNLSSEQLQKEGVALGADVPVFVLGQAAFAQGIGEILTPHCAQEHWLLVVQPDCQISTQKLFSHSQLTRGLPQCRIDTLNFVNGLGLIEPQFRNVFEPLAITLYTAVADAMKWLNQFSQARLSGTGSCIYASFESEQAAQSVAEKMPNTMNGWVVKSLNHSPAHEALGRLSR